jgi:hypothetical protein
MLGQPNPLIRVKFGKNVERHLLWTWRRACDEMQYRGSVGDWEILMRRLGRRLPMRKSLY